MKHIFIFLLAFVLCVSMLAIPAFAAEVEEYIFEYLPSVSLFADYVFFPGLEKYAVYEGRLPEGLYDVFFFHDGDVVLWSLSPISVDYSFEDDFLYSLSTLALSDGSSYDCIVTDTFDSFGGSAFVLLFNGMQIGLSGASVKLVPANNGFELPFDFISDLMLCLYQLVTGNPLFSALCASSLILVCIPIYTHAKKSVR